MIGDTSNSFSSKYYFSITTCTKCSSIAVFISSSLAQVTLSGENPEIDAKLHGTTLKRRECLDIEVIIPEISKLIAFGQTQSTPVIAKELV